MVNKLAPVPEGKFQDGFPTYSFCALSGKYLEKLPTVFLPVISIAPTSLKQLTSVAEIQVGIVARNEYEEKLHLASEVLVQVGSIELAPGFKPLCT